MVVGVIALATMTPLSAGAAACSPPPPLESTQGQRVILQTPVIVLGVIAQQVPSDAHGAFSFGLDVKTYLRGSGSQEIVVTDEANGEIPLSGLQPGGSIESSQTFVNEHAGQQALVFGRPASQPFEGQLVTDACTYTVYTTAETARVLPKVRAVLSAGKPLPRLEQTGVGLYVFAISAALMLFGATVIWAGRRVTYRVDISDSAPA